MGMIGNAPYQGVIDTGNILDGAITAAKIKAAADLLAKLGYTPVNKAGDSMSGPLIQQAATNRVFGYTGGVDGKAVTPGTGLGEVALKAFNGGFSGGDKNYAAAITFSPHDSNNAGQAGLYFNGDGSYGTKAAIATTDSYAAGSIGRLFIDHVGRVTLPYQPAFHAYNPLVTSGQAIVVYSNTRSNIGGCFSTSTGKFTAPVDGMYMFTFNSLMKIDGEYVRLLWNINGLKDTSFGDTLTGGVNGSWNVGWSYTSVGLAIVIKLMKNEWIAPWNDGPTSTWGTGYGSFSGHLIG